VVESIYGRLNDLDVRNSVRRVPARRNKSAGGDALGSTVIENLVPGLAASVLFGNLGWDAVGVPHDPGESLRARQGLGRRATCEKMEIFGEIARKRDGWKSFRVVRVFLKFRFPIT
jgi:hypothetical protein